LESSGNGTIVWLDDQPDSIQSLTEYLEGQGFHVSVYKDGDEALASIVDGEPGPDVFVVDLRLEPEEEDGLSIAKTAKMIRPAMPVVAVTEHLRLFSPDIASSLVERNYPFSGIWVKDDLATPENRRLFTKQLRILLGSELHTGKVVKVEPDYTQVTLRTPQGMDYERFFETAFLEACGIANVGDEFDLLFWKGVIDGQGEVRLRLAKRRRDGKQGALVEEVGEILARVDLGKIREKFGTVADVT
jgi:hypothetical protein